jgi:heat shock protein HslJ
MQKHDGARSRRWTAAAPLLVALAVVTLASCGEADGGSVGAESTSGSGTGAAASGVDGRTFVSTDVRKDGAPAQLAAGSVIRLTFEGGRVSANAGCNTMSGAARVEAGVLTVDGPLASTMMGCDKALMDQDAWLSELLSSGPKVVVDGATLTLTTGDAATGTVLTFSDRKVAEPDLPLEETAWRLESMSVGSGGSTPSGTAGPDTAVSSVPAGVTSTLLVSKGRIAVNAGCNKGSAAVTVDASSMTVGPMALTRMMCAEDAMSVETAVTKVLDGKASYVVEADRLTLTNAAGMLGYRAESAASATSSATSTAEPSAAEGSTS